MIVEKLKINKDVESLDDLKYHTENKDKLVIYLFGSPTCAKCKMQLKIYEGVESDKLMVVYIDGSVYTKLATENQVMSVPYSFIYKEGFLYTENSFVTKEMITNYVEEV